MYTLLLMLISLNVCTCDNKDVKYCFLRRVVILRPAVVNVVLWRHMDTPATAATTMNIPEYKSAKYIISARSGRMKIWI